MWHEKYRWLIAGISVIIAAFLLYSVFGYSFNISTENSNPTEAYFCPADDCFGIIASYISNATEVDCALYTLNSAVIENALRETDARLVSNEKCPEGIECRAKPSYRRGLMHNKFCVLDNSIVITGSFNPNENSKSYRNNAVVLYSRVLANVYSKEFEELWSGEFGKGGKGSAQVMLKDNSGDYKTSLPELSDGQFCQTSSIISRIVHNSNMAEVYFCPEDECQTHLIEKIGKAEKSIYFLVYSFTDNEIADELLGKIGEGVIVRGFLTSRRTASGAYIPSLKKRQMFRYMAKGFCTTRYSS